MSLKLKKQELEVLIGKATALRAEAGESPTQEQITKAAELKKQREELEAEIKSLEEYEAEGKQLQALKSSGKGESTDPVGKSADAPKPVVTFKSFGDALVNNEGFKAQREGGALLFKTLLDSTASSAGDLIIPQNIGMRDSDSYRKELSIANLVTVLPTTSNSVEWMQENTPVNNAANVADADSADSADNTGRLPESEISFDLKQTGVNWIGHGIPVTESTLQDVPQLQGIVDSFLRYGVLEKLEQQMISGNGTAPQFRGILNTVGIQTQAFSTDLFRTIRLAKTKLQQIGRAQSMALVLSPNDWETIELYQDAQDRYVLGGPQNVAGRTLWGMPVVTCEQLPANKAILGDFSKAILFNRSQIEVEAFNQNKDSAEKNLVYIRARWRGAFGIVRPAAFVEITTA